MNKQKPPPRLLAAGPEAAAQHPRKFVDGVDHINIWAHGDTKLGRMLSHFHYAPFNHPYFGPFNSMEGFWHFIKSEEKDDTLRRLYGLEAKRYGKALSEIPYVDDFFNIIKLGNYHKISQNPKISELFVQSALPFEYYYRSGPERQIIQPDGYDWLVAGFEELRRLMKAGQVPVEPDYSHVSKPYAPS